MDQLQILGIICILAIAIVGRHYQRKAFWWGFRKGQEFRARRQQ